MTTQGGKQDIEHTIKPERVSIVNPPTQQGDEIRTFVLNIMTSHRVETLKSISQQAHTFYVSLQKSEKFWNEPFSWLSPTFNLWGTIYSIIREAYCIDD